MEWVDTIIQAVSERRAEMADLPVWVRNWVLFMRILFFSGIVFIAWWKAPRYVVLTMVLSAIAIIAGKIFLPEIDTITVGTLSQLILWTPLLVYLIYTWRENLRAPLTSAGLYSKIYGLWIAAVTITVSVSQLFNIAGALKLAVSATT